MGANNATLASLYSSLAGVLAGFAIAGLLLVVTQRSDAARQGAARANRSNGSLALLLAAIVSLLLSALAYALMGGDPQSSRRLPVEHVLAGVAFSAGTLAFGLALALQIGSIAPELDRSLRRLMRVAAPSVLVLFIALGTWRATASDRPAPASLVVAITVGLAAQLTGAIVALLTSRRIHLTEARQVRIANICMLIAFLATSAVAVLSALPPDVGARSAWLATLAFLVGCIGTALFTAVVGRSEPSMAE